VGSIPVAGKSVDHTRAAALEKAKLQKHFGRIEIFFFLLCTLVGIDTIGAVAANGPEGFTWLIVMGLVFFLPYGLLTAELGAAFPEEGGPYVWTKLAFGRFGAAINAVIYWLSNPIWLGGTLAILAVAAFSEFIYPLHGIWKYLFAIAFIWIGILAAVLSFAIGKWIPTIGAWVRIVVFGFFTVSVIVYAIKNGVSGFGFGDFKPSYIGFVALVPLIFFNYVGFELPSTAGEEMKDPQKDVPFAVIRAALGTILLYGAPILAILLVLPKNGVTSLGGFLDAIKQVFTVYGGTVASEGHPAELTGLGAVLGTVACICFILALLSSGTTWIMGADRAQAAAGFDGAAPRSFGHLSGKYGTPIVVNIWSGAISTVIMFLAYQLTGGNTGKYFVAVLGLAISTTTISYLLIFPTLYKLRKSHPDVERPYRVPGGDTGALIISIVTTAFAALATLALLWPGFLQKDAELALRDYGFCSKINDVVHCQRFQYELSQLVPLAIFVGMGVVFYFMGKRTREQEVDIPFEAELAQDAGGTPPASSP
jgi:amino acid transporter